MNVVVVTVSSALIVHRNGISGVRGPRVNKPIAIRAAFAFFSGLDLKERDTPWIIGRRDSRKGLHQYAVDRCCKNRQAPVFRLKSSHRRCDLHGVVSGLGFSGGVEDGVDCWEQEGHEDTDDGDHDEEFDEGESGVSFQVSVFSFQWGERGRAAQVRALSTEH